MNVIPLDVRINVEAVAGQYPHHVLRADLKKYLGKSAWLAWRALTRRRDKQGISYATLYTIGNAPEIRRLSPDKTKRAFRRLKEAGLLYDLAIHRRKDEKTKLYSEQRKRKVCGVLAITNSSEKPHIVLVPGSTAAWVEQRKKRTGWGGARRGAGGWNKGVKMPPRPGIEPWQLTETDADIPWCVYQKPEPSREVEELQDCPAKPSLELQDCTPYDLRTTCIRDGNFVLSSTKKELSCAPARARDLIQKNQAPLPTTPAQVSPEPVSNPVTVSVSESLGTRIGPSKPLPRVAYIPGRLGIPLNPTPDSLAQAYTPNPPKLPETPEAIRDAKTLLKSYIGACERRFRKTKAKCWGARSALGAIAASRWFKMLQSAAAYMRENEIRPAAWCAWRADGWASMGNTKPPPVQWVFSMKALEELEGWFQSEAPHYGGNALVLSPAGMQIISRHAAMMRALYSERPMDQAGIAAVVSRFFPGDLYEKLTFKAREENKAKQQELESLMARGFWIWN